MAIFEFGEFTPDQADLASGVNTARNVYPAALGYRKVEGLVAFSEAVSERPLGAFTAKDKDGNVFNFVGTATTLQQLTSGDSWTDVTNTGGAYTTSSGEFWEFVKWKEKVLATNWDDNPQQITLGDANFTDLTSTLKARHIAVVRDFVVLGNTFDSGDGNVPFRVRWSANDDETDFTVSAATQSDFQDLKGDGGAVQAIVGGEFGVIFQERSIWRMSFVGGAPVFAFDNILPGKGTPAPRSVVSAGNRIFFLSQDGFEMLVNGQQLTPIGSTKVNRTFFDDLDGDNIERMNGVADVKNTRVLWAYPGANNSNGRPNKIIVYDWVLDKWSTIEDEVELMTIAASTGISLDDLDTVADSQGPELVTNGAFDTDSDWTKGTGWSISGGNATHASGTGSDLEQSVSITAGQFYFVSFTVSGRTAGSITPKVGGTAGTAQTTNDTFTETIEAGSSNSLIEFTATSDFDGNIDDVSLVQTSIDLIDTSLDSADFTGGELSLASFDENNALGFWNGSAMTARIDTTEQQLTPGKRTKVTGFRSLVNDNGGTATVTIRVGTRNRQIDSTSFSAPTNVQSSGKYARRSNARFHRFRVDITGDFTNAVGVDVDEFKTGSTR